MRLRPVLVVASAVWLAACSQSQKPPLILATATSTQDTGLLDALVPAFEKDSGYSVKVVAVGTGEALRMAQLGDADVLLAHAPALEQSFMEKGFGEERRAVMHNEFVLLGPAADPAHVKGGSAVEAFKKIAAAQARFISRADKSGTHKKELALWKAAAVVPAAAWYIEAGQGMAECLKIASEKKAYFLSDRGTYLVMKGRLSLDVLVEGDPALFNAYHVITVSPKMNPKANSKGARAFLEFITGAKGQKMIHDFGTEEYGQPLFIPDATKPQGP